MVVGVVAELGEWVRVVALARARGGGDAGVQCGGG
mgnify:CR=1 FL=1